MILKCQTHFEHEDAVPTIPEMFRAGAKWRDMVRLLVPPVDTVRVTRAGLAVRKREPEDY